MNILYNPHAWFLSLIGGLLIGLATAVLLFGLGRIAGISGVLGRLLFERGPERLWQLLFVAGLMIGTLIVSSIEPSLGPEAPTAGWIELILAGLLVGYGTRLGSGCTSGHGICGLSRLSPRSIVATAIFMSAGFLTVFVLRHLVAV